MILACFTACSPHALREAQVVIRQADSAWTAGQPYHDSVQLAQAYETLSSFPAQVLATCHPQLATDYAHACYHYGRLLRSHDDPVAAMQCFINASHSRTRDFHILGRVYSNMGDLCHLASEFDMAYQMYDHTAEMYLKNGDTLLYYYGLYRMAYELAEQGKLDSCFAVTEKIKRGHYEDSALMAHCYLSQAQACLRSGRYKEAISHARQSNQYLPSLPSSILQLAQAYSFLGVKDSATLYAQQVLSISNALSDINSALYILTNDDETKDKMSIRQTAADRSDTQKLLAIRQGKVSQAVQLLQQDMEKVPNWAWLYGIIATLFVVGTGMGIYVHRKRKKKRLLVQKLDALTHATSTMQEKHDELEQRYITNHIRLEDDINQKCAILRKDENLVKTLYWTKFEALCRIIDQQFYLLASKLQNKNVLNETEIRLCILVMLDFGRAEIAKILPYAPNSVGKLKDQTAKSLGTTGKNLHDFLLKMAIEE